MLHLKTRQTSSTLLLVASFSQSFASCSLSCRLLMKCFLDQSNESRPCRTDSQHSATVRGMNFLYLYFNMMCLIEFHVHHVSDDASCRSLESNTASHNHHISSCCTPIYTSQDRLVSQYLLNSMLAAKHVSAQPSGFYVDFIHSLESLFSVRIFKIMLSTRFGNYVESMHLPPNYCL